MRRRARLRRVQDQPFRPTYQTVSAVRNSYVLPAALPSLLAVSGLIDLIASHHSEVVFPGRVARLGYDDHESLAPGDFDWDPGEARSECYSCHPEGRGSFRRETSPNAQRDLRYLGPAAAATPLLLSAWTLGSLPSFYGMFGDKALAMANLAGGMTEGGVSIAGVGGGTLAAGAVRHGDDARNAASAARYRLTLAADEIFRATRSGSALKADPMHRAASFLTRSQLAAGKLFTIRGGDGVQRQLLQTVGAANGRDGIFEFILDASRGVTHQRFIAGGRITGVPNQRVK